MIPYLTPEASVLPVDAPAVLCESPKPGGNEDLVYDEWQLNGYEGN